MGLIDRLLGRDPEGLPALPAEARILDVRHLEVRTADGLVVVTVDVHGMAALVDAARDHAALQLRGPGRNVTVVPTRREEKIVLDPDHGWIVPLTRAQAQRVAEIDVAEGEHDLGFVAVVVE